MYKNKKEAFAYFGAVQKNEVWSWAATTPEKDKVVVTIWAHEINGKGTDQYYDSRELETITADEWQDGNGNTERIELLKLARDNLDGVLNVALLKAVDKNASEKKIDTAYPWSSAKDDHRMKLTFLDEETGDWRAEYLDSVPKK
jgi:hypothetical protein